MRLHRAVWCVGEWRLPVEQCWIIPSCDVTPAPVCSTNQHSEWTTEHKPSRTGLPVSPIFNFPLCVTILPEQWWEDMHCCQHGNVVSPQTVKSRFAWVNIYADLSSLVRHLSDNNSSDYGLVQMWCRRKGNPWEFGLAARSGKHWMAQVNTYSVKYYPDTVLRERKLHSAINSNKTIHFKMRWLVPLCIISDGCVGCSTLSEHTTKSAFHVQRINLKSSISNS